MGVKSFFFGRQVAVGEGMYRQQALTMENDHAQDEDEFP